MVIAIVPALVAVLGVLVYALASGKASQIGLYCFGAGLLVTLFVVARHVVHLGG